MKNKMKDCPFCGNSVDVEDEDAVYPVTRKDENGRQIFRAGCIESYGGGCGAQVLHDSAEEAILRWNTRIGENND